MNELAWLVNRQCVSVVHREFDWVFSFEKQTVLTVGCLWRLLDAGRIVVTSEDDGHQFGRPAPIVADEIANRLLVGSSIASIVLKPATLDLELSFQSGHVLQVIPNSSGYEAWNLHGDSKQYVAVGGGELAIDDA